MLQTLHIKNLALVESAQVDLENGLNVVSGETGGGKSLLITALKLLRGERGSATLVRHGAEELRVEALFRLGEGERSRSIHELLKEQCGAETEDEALVVVRTLDQNGRSKVRINGHLATLPLLRDLGEHLLEIHGQGEARSLMRSEIQAEMLDAFGGTTDLREQYAGALAEAKRFRHALDETKGDDRARRQRVAMLEDFVRDLEALGVREGELQGLEIERNVLANLDRMRALLTEALGALSDGEPSSQELISRAERSLAEAAALDGRLTETHEQLGMAAQRVREAARTVQSSLARLDLDPQRLEEVESRIASLRRALARHGPTEVELLEGLARAKQELADFGDGEHSVERLQADLDATLVQAGKLARRLVKARRKATPLFCAAIESELQDLGMKAAVLSVHFIEEFADADLLITGTRHGPSPVDIVVRMNPGEPERRLSETASGGEMARLVIALKKCLADQDRVPFLVFDEVDAEIGGRLGLAVGKKLKEISKHHQLLIVTHLPQVAAFADAHFKVSKATSGDRTRSQVQRIAGREVERELAAMTIGDGADPTALEEAKRLVERARSAEA